MSDNKDRQGSSPEPPKHSRTMGRRSVLRLIGLGAIGVAPLPLLSTIRTAIDGQFTRSAGAVARTPDGRIRQWTMIIDLRRCDGCQSIEKPPQCTAACVQGHFAPEPMEWIEVYEGELPGGGTQFIPTPCQQCQNPPCVNVCPVGATFSTPEGTVLIDQDRCIGCRICMAACPYDRRFFNWGEPPMPEEAKWAPYDMEHQVPARKGTVMKCDFCPDMMRDDVLPYCVQGCPNDAIYYGDHEEDVATNGKEIVAASRFLSENQAYHLREDLKTKPRVYYIPGHGEDVGRDVFKEGRLPTQWPWIKLTKGARTWKR